MRSGLVLFVSVLGAAGLAGASWVWLSGTPRPSEELPKEAPCIRWVPGTRQSYRVETDVSARMHLPGADQPLGVEARLEGTFTLSVEAADASGVRLGLRLAPARYVHAGLDRAAEIGLSTPFAADFLADGLPLRFEFPPGLGDEARTVLEQLVRTFQVVVPPGAAGSWSVGEENATGRYRADYRHEGGDLLTKTKTEFVEVSGQALQENGPLEARIARSRTRIRIVPGTSWVEEVRLEEEMELTAGGTPVLESTLVATLARTNEPVTERLPREELAERELSIARAAATPPPWTPERERESRRLLEQLVQSAGRSVQAAHALRDLVATFPQAAPLVIEPLAVGALDETTSAALVDVLAQAGTPPAQEALGVILAEERFGRANGLRAAIALGGLEHPTAAALEGLWRAADRRLDSEQAELSNTALLALGALAPTQRDEAVGALEAALVARLAAAGDGDEAGILLTALGNTRNPALATGIVPHLDSSSAYVRAAAAGALGNLSAPEVEPTLASHLDGEPDARVRAALVEALGRVPSPAQATLEQVRALVLSEPGDTTRVEMARLLGANLASFPAARQTLEELVRADRSRRVRASAAEALQRRMKDGE